MTSIAYEIRLMRKEDIPEVLDLWRESEMDKPAHSLSTWFKVDPGGFYVAVTDIGDVVGVCSAVLQHKNLAVIGSYCVKRKYRGLGIGRKVWKACNERIGSRNAAVSAVPGKIELYRDTCGYPIVEKEWVALLYRTTASLKVNELSDSISEKYDIRPYTETDLPLMIEYFSVLMGYKLDLAIRLSCKEADSLTCVAIKNDSCVGFGSVKISYNGEAHVTPLYADCPLVAEFLLKKLLLSLSQAKGYVIKTVSSNRAANEIAQRLGWSSPELIPRLYRKRKLKVDTNKVFALSVLSFAPF
ncbi:uncharacterized protein LOC129221275 [Uloborus diversus]|uniref:uncharacterized protein LOC129221275 n=1 Tax=Uloborus diversus TaxID=327109 RepID=UPI00240A1D1B|nr:uncharacterized protein LOC129221275 [Uloborus diversus]XP_054711706.1 uncharacterized protein LOC129221275 [Uloborus diversus]